MNMRGGVADVVSGSVAALFTAFGTASDMEHGHVPLCLELVEKRIVRQLKPRSLVHGPGVVDVKRLIHDPRNDDDVSAGIHPAIAPHVSAVP